MTHEERERLLRLQSHEMHEAVDTTPGIEVGIFTHGEGNFTAAVKDTNWSLNRASDMLLLSDHSGEILIYDHETDITIALLQRARQIMGGQ